MLDTTSRLVLLPISRTYQASLRRRSEDLRLEQKCGNLKLLSVNHN